MTTFNADIDYIREQLRNWHAQQNLPHPGVPVEMRVDPTSKEEWQSWRLIDSTYGLQTVEEFESRLPAPLPQFFKAYILSCHTMNMDFGEYQLPESWSNRTLEQNFYELLITNFWGAGYMQFGAARGCGDPLLFDFQSPNNEGDDYAVVLFNHDVVPHEAIGNRDRLRPYETRLAPSFREFFELLLEYNASIFPAPVSPEEERRNEAWREVATLLEEKGLPPYHRPAEVSPTDPWAIAEFLRNS
jgi:SMI1 / KNR4 family (SUKH-1)